MRVSWLLGTWNEFFFKPCSPLPVAVFRILYGILLLQCFVLQLGPDFDFWYGPHAIIAPGSAREFLYHFPVFDVFMLFGANVNLWHMYFYTLVIAAVSLMIGFGTRFSALYCFLGLVSLLHENPFNTNGGDCLMRVMCFYLFLSQSGKVLSIDHLISKARGTKPCQIEFWPWAQRLMQIQIATMYCQASICKLCGPQWVDGSAIFFVTRFDDLFGWPVPFLFDTILACKLISWFAVLIEVSLWTLIWVKEFRYWVLLAGVMLHLGIDFTLNLPIFQWLCICSLVVFVEPRDLMRLIVRSRQLLTRWKMNLSLSFGRPAVAKSTPNEQSL